MINLMSHSEPRVLNPLDSLEDIFVLLKLPFQRATDSEIAVTIDVEDSSYTLLVSWLEKHDAILISCRYDLALECVSQDAIQKFLCDINRGVWIGHFEMMHDDVTPCFRHTSLFKASSAEDGADHIQELIDIAVQECQRHRAAFDLLNAPQKANDNLDTHSAHSPSSDDLALATRWTEGSA